MDCVGEKRFFIGSYTKTGGPGVAMCCIRGNQLQLCCNDPLPNATYVILNRQKTRLYAICSDATDDSPGGSVAAYRVDDKQLILLSRVNTVGAGPCHLCLDSQERFLYTANYFTGSLSAFALGEQGEIVARIQHICHEGHSVHPVRQTAPHVHQVTFIPGTHKLCAVDLGLDQLVVYDQDPQTGILTHFSTSHVPSGLGPRHLLYAPDGRVYLACEVGNRVATLQWNGRTFETHQVLSTLPVDYAEKNTASAIRMLNGRIYVSNRGHDSIAVYDIAKDSLLSLVGIYGTGENFPRDFAFVDDETILVGHQNGSLTVEKLTSSGLIAVGSLNVAGCVCVCIE